MPPKKASAPGIGLVIVADVGPSSGKQSAKGETQAERIKEFLINLIRQKIFLNSSDEIGIVLFGCEETKNELFKEGKSFYKHVAVLNDMNKANWDMAKSINERVFEPTKYHGDWIDALSVSLDLIQQRVQAGMVYEKTQVVVITDFESPCNSTRENERLIKTALLNQHTSLYFINSNLKQQTEHEDVNKSVKEGALVSTRLIENLNDCGFVGFDELYGSVVLYSSSPTTKGTPWNVNLEIGAEIKIPVSGYIKVTQGSHTTWKEGTINDEPIERGKVFQKVSSADSTNVDRQDILPAYKYGSKYFPIAADTEATFDYKSGSKCLTVIAFCEPVPPHLYLGNSTMYFFAGKNGGFVDVNAQKALSAFINGMEELGREALVRRVYRDNSRVQLGVLSPRIKMKYECLVFHELPFGDDVRQFVLPPIITPKNQPNAEQLKAFDDLIDKFDLISAEERGDFPFESTKMVDPYEEYIRHMTAFKALHPDDNLPPIPEHIQCLTRPQPSVVEAAKDVLGSIKALFPLKQVDRLKFIDAETAKRIASVTAGEDELENPSKKMRSDENAVALGVIAILGGDVVKIGTESPTEDFVQLLKIGKKSTKEVYGEMENVILHLLRDSHGSNIVLMNKSRDCLVVYRQHVLDSGNPIEFNQWMERFKSYVIANFFQDFWQSHIVKLRLGLITWNECDASSVDKQQADQFFQLPSQAEEPTSQTENEEDVFDLI